jgi:hypothetical protein
MKLRLERYPRALRFAAWISELRPSKSPLDRLVECA